MTTAEVPLPWNEAAPAAARQATRRLLEAWRAVCEPAPLELLVSEVVTNAYRHGEPPMSMVVDLRADHLWVGVSDGSINLPAFSMPDAGESGGRGLVLLGRLASRWGVDAAESAKTVWFELPRSDQTPL